ncbi:MAG: hypothetical protein K8E66_06990, partial [Phycisphaerales bacterium]|nr:hypothetical protein [Phycisphaerales bacterium]
MNIIATIAVCAAAASITSAQQVYTGLDFEFSKASGADHTLPENQDRMTGNVWITRAKTQGIFNIAQETSFTGFGANSPSPIGTRWAFGSAADHQFLNFTTWGFTHGGNPPGLIGQDLVVHLVDDDIYLDIRFTAWGQGFGGAFTYLRSVIPGPCNAADIAEPFGVLDLADITAFVSAFVAGDDAADLAEPFGVHDLADITAFVTA